MPDLSSDGDLIEQTTWRTIKAHFSHYEEFWRQHLYPLRSPGSVQPRNGIDKQFQLLAMNHYSVYVSLTRAQEKLASSKDMLFPDEIYWNLFRACELARNVISIFSQICLDCVMERPPINSKPLNRVRERVCRYRHLIHRPIQAVAIDAGAKTLIPQYDMLPKYELWTDTLYAANIPRDFVDAGQQLNKDFGDLRAALETAWVSMCECSKQLTNNAEYLKRRNTGTLASLAVPLSVSGSGVAASGWGVVSSNTAIPFSAAANQVMLISSDSNGSEETS